VPALVDRLEHDGAQYLRMLIASRMLPPLAHQPQVREALQRSAASDADHAVRWAPRYALRLDLSREPGREALARCPREGGIQVPVMSEDRPRRSPQGREARPLAGRKACLGQLGRQPASYLPAAELRESRRAEQ
jgi:hypothetical protein